MEHDSDFDSQATVVDLEDRWGAQQATTTTTQAADLHERWGSPPRMQEFPTSLPLRFDPWESDSEQSDSNHNYSDHSDSEWDSSSHSSSDSLMIVRQQRLMADNYELFKENKKLKLEVQRVRQELQATLRQELQAQTVATQEPEHKCVICQEPMHISEDLCVGVSQAVQSIADACGHLFHQTCAMEYLRTKEKRSKNCPVCRENLPHGFKLIKK